MPLVCGGCLSVWFARPDAMKGSLVDTLKVSAMYQFGISSCLLQLHVVCC